MAYCPKCDDHEDGEIQWCRRCALIVYVAGQLEAVGRLEGYRHYPKE
ncbi:hypothetical protein [Natrinema sp. DC36]|nr:hypothetical protein [Natrinema sp. DC36]